MASVSNAQPFVELEIALSRYHVIPGSAGIELLDSFTFVWLGIGFCAPLTISFVMYSLKINDLLMKAFQLPRPTASNRPIRVFQSASGFWSEVGGVPDLSPKSTPAVVKAVLLSSSAATSAFSFLAASCDSLAVSLANGLSPLITAWALYVMATAPSCFGTLIDIRLPVPPLGSTVVPSGTLV